MKTGAELIAEERERQIAAEGFTAAHDDCHVSDELVMAARAYALPPEQRRGMFDPTDARVWPWDETWWRPTPNDRVRELVKAGALIAAEIDRLNRASGLE